MPRVPVIDAPSRMPGAPYPDTSPVLEQPLDTGGFAQGLQQLGSAVGNVAGMGLAKEDESKKAAQKAKQQAQALTIAQANLTFGQQLQSRLAEAKKLRGVQASEQRGKILDGLNDLRDEIADSIADTDARGAFLERSVSTLLNATGDVESHVGREFESARNATTKAREDQVLGTARAGVDDPGAWLNDLASAEQDLRDNADSPEHADAAARELRSRGLLALTEGLLAQGRVEEAIRTVDNGREALGTRFPDAQALIERARAGEKRNFLWEQSMRLVDGTTEAVRNADGYVDLDELDHAVALDSQPPEIRQQVEHELDRAKRIEHQRLERDKKAARGIANRADVEDRPIPGDTYEFLLKYDPEFLLAREARQRAEARAARAARERGPSEAAERRAQKEVDEEFLNYWRAEVELRPDADLEQFEQDFIVRKAEQGQDVTVSPKAYSRGTLDQVKEQKGENTAEGRARHAAAGVFRNALTQAFKLKGKPIDEVALNQRLGRALSLYDVRTGMKGKPLDDSEVAQIVAELLRVSETEVPGVFGTNVVRTPVIDLPIQGPAAPPPGAAAPPPPPAPQKSKRDAALEWLADPANANDPRAPGIRKKLGLQ